MAVIYIDPSAATNGAGSFLSPYNTWASASTWVAGNSYLQKEGTTFVGTIGPLGTGGTTNSRIIVGVYNAVTGDRITGRKGAATVNATGQSFGFNITGARPYITVEGFDIYGATSANITKTSTGSSPSESQYSFFKHLILRDSPQNGINLYGKGNKLISCDIYRNAQDGVFAVADDLEIAYCNVYNNGTTDVDGDAVQLLNSSNCNIHDCLIDHSQSSYKQALIVNRDDGVASGGYITNCQIKVAPYTLNQTAALKSLYIGQPNVKITSCSIEGGEFTAYLIADNISFTGNVVKTTGFSIQVGVAVRGSTIKVYNNTVLGANGLATSVGIDHSSAVYTGVDIKNNVVSGWPQGIRVAASGATYSYNAFSNCTIKNSTLAGAENTAGTGDILTLANTNFEVSPKSTSALYRTGIFTDYISDRTHQTYYKPPSIGAYESLSARGSR